MLVNLDVILLDDDKKLSLKKIRNSKTNILYSNIVSNLVIGNRQIPIQYDKALYSEEELLLIRKDSKIDYITLVDKLEEGNIDYNEVRFSEEGLLSLSNKEKKEIVIVRGRESLLKTLKESRIKGIETATIYPNLKGWLDLRYQTQDGSRISLDSINLKVVIELEDKYIFLMHEKEKRNINFVKAINILDKEGFYVAINNDTNLEKGREKVKKVYHGI